MIAAWRANFDDPKMPFCIISLCTAGEPQTPENFLAPMYDAGSYIREAQYRTFLRPPRRRRQDHRLRQQLRPAQVLVSPADQDPRRRAGRQVGWPRHLLRDGMPRTIGSRPRSSKVEHGTAMSGATASCSASPSPARTAGSIRPTSTGYTDGAKNNRNRLSTQHSRPQQPVCFQAHSLPVRLGEKPAGEHRQQTRRPLGRTAQRRLDPMRLP